jgi:sarcosine oxidase subunit gamma
MNAPLRISPLHDVQVSHAARWTQAEGMQTPASFGADDAAKLVLAGIGDLSFRRRAGVKGAGAANWLNALGIATPPRHNSFLHMDDGTLVARLGTTEYLIEDAPGGTHADRISAATPGERIYPVPRFDAALLIAGTRAPELLRQTCAFDFDRLLPDGQALAMTSMAGVGITVLALDGPAGPHFRLWCDGTWGGYLWATLVEVAGDLGGGAVGLDALGSLAGQHNDASPWRHANN